MGWENSLGEFSTVMQTLDFVSGLHVDFVSGLHVSNSPNLSHVYIRLCKHRKEVFYCFYKIFLKINSPINFLIQKDFLNTRSRQSSFPLTNQNAHLIMHNPMKFRVTKVKSKFKFVEIAREQASAV